MAEIVVTGTLKRAIRNVPMSGVVVRAMNTAAFGVGEIAYLIETAPPIKVDSDGTINGAEGFELTVPTVASGDVASYSFGLPRDNETLDTVTLELNDATDPLTLEEAIAGGTPDTGGAINVSGKIYLPFSGLPYPTGFVRVQLVERFVTDDGIFLAVSEDIKIDNGDFNGASGLTLYVPDGQSEWLFTFPDGTAKTAMLGTHTSMVEIADIANGDYATALDPMNPPTSFNAVQDGVDVDLTWTDTNTGETGYRIERSDDSGATWDAVTVTAANATSYTNTSVADGDYIYRIRAEKSGGQSAWVTDTITVQPAPDAPANLTLTHTGTNNAHVLIDWDASTGADGYIVEYSINGSSWSEIQDTASTSYTHTAPTYGTVLHYYRVRGYNEVGEGANATEEIRGLMLNNYASYSFDTNSWVDAVAGTNLTGINTPTTTTGVLGNAVSLVAASSQSLSRVNIPWRGDSWTIAGWFRLTSAGGAFGILGDFNGSSNAANYVLYANNGDLTFRAYESNGIAFEDLSWATTLAVGTTYHFVLSYNLATTTASLQINGATAQTKVMVNTPNGATDDFFVGQIGDGNLYFGGWIDQLDIWIGRALSNAQGLDHYNGGTGKAFPFTP